MSFDIVILELCTHRILLLRATTVGLKPSEKCWRVETGVTEPQWGRLSLQWCLTTFSVTGNLRT